MNKKRSILNVGVAVIFKFAIMLASIITRRFLIQYVGNDVNGLNSLYLSIIGFLSVAELGVGNAITFGMYRPIAEGDDSKVAALYQLFKKSYLIIGLLILIIGSCLMPALPILAKGYSSVDENLYVTYFIMLASVVLSYMFSAKTSLINAYGNNYITTSISSIGTLLQYALQIATLCLTGSFTAYLLCRIIAISAQWGITDILVAKKHKNIMNYSKVEVDKETKIQIIKNIKAMFMHRIGGILVNSSDSMIISAFIGIVVLGKYSNYLSILTAMVGVITLFFSPLTSIIGQMFVSEPEKTQKYYSFFHTFNYLLGVVFFLGYYAVIDNLVSLLFGDNLEVAKSISFVITVNYFIQFMRQSTLLFRDATGTFYNDRWKPLFEGLANIVLSISLVVLLKQRFGDEIGLVGVIVATIITNLAICHIVEPYVLYRYAFHQSPKSQWLKNYAYIAVFVVALVIESFCLQNIDNEITEMLVNGAISISISLLIILIVTAFDRNYRVYCKPFLSKQR